jgi:hypothetical protein
MVHCQARFSGRWHDAGAEGCLAAVKDYMARRVWRTRDFAGGEACTCRADERAGSRLGTSCVRIVSLEQQVDVHRHLPADRVATAGQLHLPLESEVAAVEARVELQSRDLAEAAQPR